VELAPAGSSRLAAAAAVGSHLVEDIHHMIVEGIAGRPAGSILGSTWRQCYVGAEGARELRNGYCSMLASRGCRKSMEEVD